MYPIILHNNNNNKDQALKFILWNMNISYWRINVEIQQPFNSLNQYFVSEIFHRLPPVRTILPILIEIRLCVLKETHGYILPVLFWHIFSILKIFTLTTCPCFHLSSVLSCLHVFFVLQLKETQLNCSGCSTWSGMTHVIMSGELTVNIHVHTFIMHSLSQYKYSYLISFFLVLYAITLNSVIHQTFTLHCNTTRILKKNT